MLLLTSKQMQQVDAYTIEHAQVSALALMEVAGVAVAKEAIRIAGENHTFAVVVGKGHNGADGLVAARHLLSYGRKVVVYMAYEPTLCSPLCQAQLKSYEVFGGYVAKTKDSLSDADVIIDALLGTGAVANLRDELRTWTVAIREAQKLVVSIDVPTGVNASTGEADQDAVLATVTVAMGFLKIGHYQHKGHVHSGRIVQVGLSMPESLARSFKATCHLLTKEDASLFLPVRAQDSHKGSYKTIGVFAGSEGMYGAAFFASLGAYKTGAGLVRLLAAETAVQSLMTFIAPEVVQVPIHEVSHTIPFVQAIVDQLRKTAVGLCGPGIGQGVIDLAREHPEAFLSFADLAIPLVLDADFLHALSAMPDRGTAFFARRKEATIITPHPKEFGRLLGLDTADVQRNRVVFATDFAQKNNVIVVLKGAGTVIALPDRQSWINFTGNSGLATGGTGDVLAGMIAGLIANSDVLWQAVCAAVYLHGLSADLVIQQTQSEESLMASDILAWVGKAFHQLRDQKVPL